MLLLLSAWHGTVACPSSASPSGLGDPLGSHITMPSQKVGCSWKPKVPPLPSCFGRVGGSLGSAIWEVTLFPEPARFDQNTVDGSSCPISGAMCAPWLMASL